MLLRLNVVHRVFRQCSYSKFTESAVNWDYISNPDNYEVITSNIISRKVHCDLKIVLEELNQLHNSKNDPEKTASLKKSLTPKLFWFPNSTHPRVLKNKSEEPIILEKVGLRTPFTYFPASFEQLTRKLNLLRRKNLGQMCGSKSYFLKSDLSLLEQALVRYSVSKLIKKGFVLMSVPDILNEESFKGCGMKTENKHSQVYHLYDEWAPNLCLSGTSEMALASYLAGKEFSSRQLPLKICAVSRCYRAEANKHQKEKGIFRVHYFTKVEMFAVTSNHSGESEEMLDHFACIQREIFSELGLHFKVIEMPPCELGLPAYHKIDMEAWIPTQKIYGEISSASNCTDFQSRRLNITYDSPNSELSFCHTINGTACAIPRLLITILENYQNLGGSITVPVALRKYLKKDVINEKFKEVANCIRPIP